MKFSRLKACYIIIIASLLSGCVGIGTDPTHIQGSYVPISKFRNLTCKELSEELIYLKSREHSLSKAQEARRDSNRLQAFVIGIGNGDGMEAMDLSLTRGDIISIEKNINKRCRSLGDIN